MGKTSLTRRFISDTYPDQYLTTLGVKIETKSIPISSSTTVKLVIWDIAGADKLSSIGKTYIQGTSGYLLIADGTRKSTLESAMVLHASIQEQLPKTPYIGLLNKADLKQEWEIGKEEYTRWPEAHDWCKTSALNGAGVNDAFVQLAKLIAHKQ